MMVNKDFYECLKCGELYSFDTSEEYNVPQCPKCKCNLTFYANLDYDTEPAGKVYDPTEDPNSPYYIPVVKCPYCLSPNTSRISAVSRFMSVGFFGLGSKKAGKQYHCNKCKSDF